MLNPSAPSEAPPPYSTLPAQPAAGASSPAQLPGQSTLYPGGPPGLVIQTTPGYSHSNNAHNLRLGYADFVPRLVERRYFKGDKYESFEVLIQRANSWLQENNGVHVMSCETITWTGRKIKDIFADSTVQHRSSSSSQKTRCLRGLRLWYYADIFPTATPRRSPVIICKNYLPRENERFDQLIYRVNERLISENNEGERIITAETVCVPYRKGDGVLVDVNISYWSEAPDKAKHCLFFTRVFSLVGVQDCGRQAIGFQDFLPEHNQRIQDNQGYELFSEVMDRASRWIARQQGVRFINIQTLPVKMKKRGKYEDRCFFTQHACANGSLGRNKATRYLSMIRVMFVTLTIGDVPPVRLTCKTFVPGQTRPVTRSGPAEYENTRQVLDRINQWLGLTGAMTFGFETVPFRMTTGSQQAMGSEATFTKMQSSFRNIDTWLFYIRLYLDGEYFEPPGAQSFVSPR